MPYNWSNILCVWPLQWKGGQWNETYVCIEAAPWRLIDKCSCSPEVYCRKKLPCRLVEGAISSRLLAYNAQGPLISPHTSDCCRAVGWRPRWKSGRRKRSTKHLELCISVCERLDWRNVWVHGSPLNGAEPNGIDPCRQYKWQAQA